MELIKRSLAPGLASFGVLAHMRGNHAKAVSRIERAFRWVPQLCEMPEYSGYLGLSLVKLGRADEAQSFLEKSLRGFEKIKFIDKDERQIKTELKSEIESALHASST